MIEFISEYNWVLKLIYCAILWCSGYLCGQMIWYRKGLDKGHDISNKWWCQYFEEYYAKRQPQSEAIPSVDSVEPTTGKHQENAADAFRYVTSTAESKE